MVGRRSSASAVMSRSDNGLVNKSQCPSSPCLMDRTNKAALS